MKKLAIKSFFTLISIVLVLLAGCQQSISTPISSAVQEVAVVINRDSIRKDSIKIARHKEDILDSLHIQRIKNAADIKIHSFKNHLSARFTCDSFSFHKGHLINATDIHILLSVPDRNRYFVNYFVLEPAGDSLHWLLKANSDHICAFPPDYKSYQPLLKR